LVIPLTVGFARVYVGAHLPLDIVGGWAIGIACAFAVHLAVGRPDLRVEKDDVPKGREGNDPQHRVTS
jgi:undecaprenyl-diphosphatase